MERSYSFIATPPGATIKEQIVDRGMNQKEFAARMGMSEKHISKLINGEVQLTIDVSIKLEMVLGVPAQFWCNLESIYREKIAKVNEENKMDKDILIAKMMPYKEMVSYGWVEDVTRWQDRVIYLRKYFEIAQLNYLKDSLVPGIVYRRLSEKNIIENELEKNESHKEEFHESEFNKTEREETGFLGTIKMNYALIAWAQKAKVEARKITTKPINIAELQRIIPQIKSMTQCELQEFRPGLVDLLASCGIAIVFLPHIEGAFWHGATFIDGNKIVVGLTVQGENADKFWFDLFHELGHIIYGHISKKDGTTDEDEKCADEFAENVLMEESKYIFADE